MNQTTIKRTKRLYALYFILIFIAIGLVLVLRYFDEGVFNGRQALADVRHQVELGARTPGSDAHRQTGDWILAELQAAGWQVGEQAGMMDGHPVRNLTAKRGSGKPWYILGAHYDTRLVANRDEDPARQALPVPGANDGASGVAVLLGLARALPEGLPGQVWLVFFDVEDQGNLAGWDWILGSRFFVENLEGNPDGVVVVDMIGDADLAIFQEGDSDPALTDAIWDTAEKTGYSRQFPRENKYSILDDHRPFIERGIPAALVIDMDYPWWHTTKDTPDKVSGTSLDVVGTTLYFWLIDALGE